MNIGTDLQAVRAADKRYCAYQVPVQSQTQLNTKISIEVKKRKIPKSDRIELIVVFKTLLLESSKKYKHHVLKCNHSQDVAKFGHMCETRRIGPDRIANLPKFETN